MNFGRLDFGTKDAVLAIAGILVLLMTIVFHWSAWECILSLITICIAFYAGTMKQDKRIQEKQNDLSSK